MNANGDMENSERAARAEQAVLAYIDAGGPHAVPWSNGLDTWINDLIGDLRHLARFSGFVVLDELSQRMFAEEVSEDADGVFVPAGKWEIDGAPFSAALDGSDVEEGA